MEKLEKDLQCCWQIGMVVMVFKVHNKKMFD